MKRTLALILSLMLVLFAAAAQAGHGVYHIDYMDNAPNSVWEHIGDKWPGFILEDYIFLAATEPATGAALIEKDGHRVLVLYRDRSEGMTYWYSTDKAVPQGEGEAWFSNSREMVSVDGFGYTTVSNELGFRVTRYDLIGDYYNQQVSYQWEDGGFALSAFNNLDLTTENAVVEEGKITYYCEGEKLGSVSGDVQRDLRYASFATLPKTLSAARRSITAAPDLPSGMIVGAHGQRLTAREIEFTGGRNYPVYLGPGTQYARSANGKGSVSTNDWIQVFGHYDGYIMIQYDINADRYRIGWIEEAALPDGADVPELDLYLDHADYNSVVEPCILTDDPFNSRTVLATLEEGHELCELVYDMGGWSYVRVMVNGELICGFVPSDCINHG